MSVIEIDNLQKYYGDFHAVKGVSFSVNKGEVLGLLGPNGAGKSTTIRSLCGYIKPTSGQIRVLGKSVVEDSLETKKNIGYLPESAPLYGEMVVYDYLKYIAEIRRVENAEMRIRELASQCGLKEKMHFNVNELSKGYKQRVGLAHAMMNNPEILVLDEPTSGLDPNQIIEIRDLIRQIGKERTVILSTHILPEVEATCDRVVIISNGKVVANGTTKELKGESENVSEINIELSGVETNEAKEAINKVQGVSNVGVVSLNGFIRMNVSCDSKDDVRPALYEVIKSKPWTLLGFKQETKSLENIFRELTKE